MNRSGLDKVTMTLIHLLCGKKRDGLILLDGKWGTGKTYYLNFEFKKKYNKKTVFIISVLGINSIETFKSEIFNETCINLSEDIKELPKITSAAVALSTKTPAATAPINNIFDSITSTIRNKKLSTLEGLLIIDDIERIDPKLAEEILNHCHSIYMKNDKVDFIVVSNTTEKHSLKVEHKEKIISNSVPFIPTEDDVYILFEKELSFFSNSYINYLKRIIKKHELVNIRIIKSIILGLFPLFKYKKENPNKVVNTNLELVISVYSALIILSRVHDYTLPEIRAKRKTVEKEITELNNLLDDATSTGVPDVVKEYAFNIVSDTDVIDSIFFDKKKIKVDEIVLSLDILTSDIEEDTAIQTLLSIVHPKEKKPLKRWIAAVENYKTLTAGKYIITDESITNELLMSIADSYTKDEVSECLYIEKSRTIEETEINKIRNEGDIRKYLSYKHSYNEKNLKESAIKKDIVSLGWHLFNTERLDGVGHKFSPVRFIGEEILSECILTKWTIADIQSFRYYLYNLYDFSNISDFLSDEYTHLTKMVIILKEKIANSLPSFRYGSILSLIEVIDSITMRLQPQDS
ncbi:TPA: P-loop NTPase fold protein [Klebsiella pneumoniae]